MLKKKVFVFGDGENWFKQNECIALAVSPYMATIHCLKLMSHKKLVNGEH